MRPHKQYSLLLLTKKISEGEAIYYLYLEVKGHNYVTFYRCETEMSQGENSNNTNKMRLQFCWMYECFQLSTKAYEWSVTVLHASNFLPLFSSLH